MEIDDYSSRLHVHEKKIIEKVISKRRNEFSTGRYALHLLLAENNISNFAVLKDKHGLPILPAGFVGSISHNDSHCFVAVGKAEETRSIGVDIESFKIINEKLHKYFLTKKELDNINYLSCLEKQLAAGIIFSAKEAFFKMQFCISRNHIAFHDFQITFDKEFQLCVDFNSDNVFSSKKTDIYGYYQYDEDNVYTLFINKK